MSDDPSREPYLGRLVHEPARAARSDGGGGGRSTPPRGRGRMAFLIVAAVFGVAVMAGSGWAIRQIYAANASVPHLTTCPTGTTAAQANQEHCLLLNVGKNGKAQPQPACFTTVCNYLILGSDSRGGLTSAQQSVYGSASTITGQRSDTMMLVHVDIPRNLTTILSIPRDLRVEIPGHGINKITAALDYGPNESIKTVEALTGLTINHYIQVNFTGFMGLVNAVGGVPICVSQPMIDTYSGLHLPHAGCYRLRGKQALAFVRARHIPGDAIPDFSRIARQQQFMRAVMQKITSPLVSITNFQAILTALHHGVAIDEGMNLYDLQDLTRRLDSIGQSGVEFRSLPALPVTIGGIDYVEMQQPEASRIFWCLQHNKPLGKLGLVMYGTPPSPATISVQVYDAGNATEAQKVARYLGKAGFQVIGVKQAPAGLATSEILYGAPAVDEMKVLSAYLPRILVKESKQPPAGADITVVVGSGFKILL